MARPPRPKRRWRVLAIAATAATVLLGAAWGASLWRGVMLYLPIVSGRGDTLRCQWGGLLWDGSAGDTGIYAYPVQGRAPPASVRWTLGWVRIDAGPVRWTPVWLADDYGPWLIFLPLWIPTAASVLAALTFWRIDTLHRRRLRTNLCPACTYPRTGLPAAAPCPECGAPPAPAAPTIR